MSKGGILFDGDWNRLKDSAIRVVERFPGEHLNFVEIGVHEGLTSRDLIAEIKQAIGPRPLIHNIPEDPLGGPTRFTYFGIDPSLPPPLGSPYIHIQEISHLAVNRVSEHIHWCLVDGCHCAACVARDAILYGNRIVKGGELLFHDASPRPQGRDRQDYGSMEGFHDSVIAAARGIDVRRVLDAGLLAGFGLVLPAQIDQELGGVECYEKI